MKHWVFAFRVDPPIGFVVSARTGGSVFFAAYSRPLDQWFMVYPGGEERIAEPQMLFLEEEYVSEHTRDLSKVVRRPTTTLRQGKQKTVQFELAI